jgi:hydroxymethylglutaryl-CoA lyase
MKMPLEVRVVEVGPRDGLQNLKQFLETEKKTQLIKLLANCGVKYMEATSFVHPKAIPQFKDAKEIVAGIIHIPGVKLRVLVPNLFGAKGALEAGIRELAFVFSVSESHNKNNVNKTREESVGELEKILELKKQYGNMSVMASLSTTFGCPFEGAVKDTEILRYVEKVINLGVTSITLADTVGYGNPKQVRHIVRRCLDQFPSVTFGAHFHNTRGLGLANALVCLEEGITILDSSIGGLGGCPYAPGATGNIATEDLVFMLESMGIRTGIDIQSLLQVAKFLCDHIKDVALASNLFKAGIPTKGNESCRAS